ncbi:MAG: hypothetical protein AAFX03_05600 [Pseudomonadota bacterium]
MRVGVFAAALVAAGCQEAAEPASPERALPSETLVELPATPEPAALPVAVVAKLEEIRDLAERGQLRRLSRLAEREPGFKSNFGGERHYDHWILLRRTGVDPLAKLTALLDEPHADILVGDETWHVWPDLAARDPEDLLPERLSFRDRARLLDLIGETGLDRIRAGEPYPGFRLAVTDTGRWVYFLHESGAEEGEE